MTARPVDIAPLGPVRLPDSGLGRGWEAAALMGLTLLILSFGLVTLYSASSVYALRQDLPDTFYALRQAAGAGFGLTLLLACAAMPYRWWAPLAWPLVVVTSVLLLLCVLPWTHGIAPEIKGARRWLDLGVRFQPSEIAKIAIVVWTASLAVKKAPEFDSLRRGLMPFMVVWAVIVGLVMAGPDLSTAMVLTSFSTPWPTPPGAVIRSRSRSSRSARAVWAVSGSARGGRSTASFRSPTTTSSSRWSARSGA